MLIPGKSSLLLQQTSYLPNTCRRPTVHVARGARGAHIGPPPVADEGPLCVESPSAVRVRFLAALFLLMPVISVRIIICHVLLIELQRIHSGNHGGRRRHKLGRCYLLMYSSSLGIVVCVIVILYLFVEHRLLPPDPRQDLCDQYRRGSGPSRRTPLKG